MSFLPGWNSLESVTAAANGFSVAILVIIALVIVTGLAAYGSEYRKSALAAGAGRTALHPLLQERDTPEFLGRLHTILSAAALVAIGLFVGAEIFAQQYGQRQIELTRQADDLTIRRQNETVLAERSRADRVQQDAGRTIGEAAQLKLDMDRLKQDVAQLNKDAAQSRLEKEKAEADRVVEMTGLQQKLVKAAMRIEELQTLLTNRRLTDDEKKQLLSALQSFPGQKVTIASIAGDDDGRYYAEDFVSVFDAAGWDHHGADGISTQTWDRDPVGIEITLNEADARAGRITPGVGTLINVVRQLGLVADNTVFMNGDIPAGEVQLRIGKKLRR